MAHPNIVALPCSRKTPRRSCLHQLPCWDPQSCSELRSENLTDSAAQIVVDPKLHGRTLDRIMMVATVLAVIEEGEASLGNHCRGLIANATRERGKFVQESLVHPIGDDV